MDDTVDEAIAVEDGDSAVVDGIFDDEVLERGELAVVRAPYYDDGDSVVPANLSGGSTLPAFCRPLQRLLLFRQLVTMKLHLEQVRCLGQVQLWEQVQL